MKHIVSPIAVVFVVGLFAASAPAPKKWLVEVKDGLFASKYEVSNFEYREFVQAMGANASQYEPDSACWHLRGKHLDPVASAYFSHPAFHQYPVVGITHEQANAYCAWLTQVYREAHPSGPKMVFRLPTEEEWILAAKGGNDKAIIPWDGKKVERFVYSDLQQKNLSFKFNIKYADPLYIEYDAESKSFLDKGSTDYAKDGYMITSPVKSFPPTALGLYNLGGNVAEMIAEPGKAKGGSWDEYPYAMRLDQTSSYPDLSPSVGFRVFAEVVTE
ncbi:MAG: formylglycine-generating enzyme family protein [Bacteroidia bacterium]|nr:formylglycine-generating enzyme family protein [Bacteroidia bacterium]